MATVRMSHELKYQVRNNYKIAYKKVHPILQNAGSYSHAPQFDRTWADTLYTQYISPMIAEVKDFHAKPCFQNVDTKWAPTFKDTRFEAQLPMSKASYWNMADPDDTRNYSGSQVVDKSGHLGKDAFDPKLVVVQAEPETISLVMSTEREMPGLRESYGDMKMPSLCFTSSEVHDDPILTSISTRYTEYHKTRQQMDFEVAKVEKLLDSFTTLNQALKAWDGIRNLVDSERIAKVNQKVYRKRKQQKQKHDVDTTMQDVGINDTILTASLLGDD